jgi:hypothetical protein
MGTYRIDVVELLARALCGIEEADTVAMGKADGDHDSKLWTSSICMTSCGVSLWA